MTIEMYQDVMNHLQIDKYRELIIEQDHKVTELEKACEETQELLDKQIEATYRLDKENAELKEKLKPENCLKLLAKEGYIKFTSDQLTKAKDLLLRFVELKNKPCVSGHSINMLLYENICAETEQFLKDSEVEK